MHKWILYSTHNNEIVGQRRGYETRELAEIAAKSHSADRENWYASIGVFQMVSTARYAPKGEITRLDE